MTLARVHWFCCLLVALWTTRSAALTSTEQDAILNLHNTLRRGEGSSNMQILTWNPTLAIIAQNWSANCNFAHGQGINSSTLSSIGLGQNIYAISIPTINVSAGVMSWFNEKQNYTYNTNTCAAGKVCGHYTQVVWANTNQIGCGYTVCPILSSTSFTNAAFLVCNYAPPGNWIGQIPYLTGPACTQCSSGQLYCNNGLCDASCTAPSSTCVCAADCKNCGTKTANCRCQCGTGWNGPDCSAVCNDTNAYCNNGWYTSWCNSAHQYVLDGCPKMCGLCVGGTPAPCSTAPAAATTKSVSSPAPTTITAKGPTTAPAPTTLLNKLTTAAAPTSARVTTPPPPPPTTTPAKGTTCPTPWIPRDCYDYLLTGANFNGVYAVWPQGAERPIPVFCDMINTGGGWTVFQRRQDGSENFYRGWNDYAKGFGNLEGEFWLGNENIFLLTNNSRQYSLWIQMSDFNWNSNYAQYSNFKIASSVDKYRLLSLGSYMAPSSAAGDALSTTALGSKFSTYDQDNDGCSTGSCAVNSRGAWWYNNCGQANLNGKYYTASQTASADGIYWYPWTGYTKSLKFTEMKFKPINL